MMLFQEIENKGIALHDRVILHKSNLEEISTRELNTTQSFEYGYCNSPMLSGVKQAYHFRYVIFEDTNISKLTIQDKVIFDNCVFENVKFKDVNFNNAVFYNCVFKDSYFIKCKMVQSIFGACSGMNEMEIEECNLSKAHFIGCDIEQVNISSTNKLKSIKIDEVAKLPPYSLNEPQEVIKEERKEDKVMVKEKTENQIIEGKTYKDLELKHEELINVVYHSCVFDNVEFERGYDMDASIDFIDCTFKNMEFNIVAHKTAFDKSNFEDVVFNSSMTRCNLTRCHFSGITLTRKAKFYTCNFDFSNAYDVFADRQEYFTDVLFNRDDDQVEEIDSCEDNEIGKLFEEYIVPLVDELNKRNKVATLPPKEIDLKAEALKYVGDLTDGEFIGFITEATAYRNNKDDQNLEDDDSDEEVEDFDYDEDTI